MIAGDLISFKYHIKEGYKEVAHINTVGKKYDRWILYAHFVTGDEKGGIQDNGIFCKV